MNFSDLSQSHCNLSLKQFVMLVCLHLLYWSAYSLTYCLCCDGKIVEVVVRVWSQGFV